MGQLRSRSRSKLADRDQGLVAAGYMSRNRILLATISCEMKKPSSCPHLLFLDSSLLQHVADNGSVVGTVEAICVHAWVLWQTELALSRDTTFTA